VTVTNVSIKEREQHKETVNAAAKRALVAFQTEISEVHLLLTVSRQLAVIDCLISLATVALANGYCRPMFVSEALLKVKAGRHPMVESLREEAYVPFDAEFSDILGRSKVITGPNMAGKSSCVRAIVSCDTYR
jgi:DNA mismatch repair protein MSH3